MIWRKATVFWCKERKIDSKDELLLNIYAYTYAYLHIKDYGKRQKKSKQEASSQVKMALNKTFCKLTRIYPVLKRMPVLGHIFTVSMNLDYATDAQKIT